MISPILTIIRIKIIWSAFWYNPAQRELLGGVYLSFSSGMSTATTTANTPYNLLEIENNGTVLFLFSYAGRRGIYAANQDKITEIAPSRAVNINQEEGSHKLYVDASSRKVYFTSVNSQSISWKILQVL